jgi:hypothetical protein
MQRKEVKGMPILDEILSYCKLPLGVMPKRVYNEKRVQELTRALNDYANYNIKANKELMLEWTKELTELLERM